MTQDEIEETNRVWQEVNDTEDFYTWQNRRVSGNLPRSYEDWQAARERALADQKRLGADSRWRHRANLEAMRKTKESESDTKLDVELGKATQLRQWLVDHPGKTESDFNREAWHHLRQNLIEQRENDALEAELQAAKTSGIYGL